MDYKIQDLQDLTKFPNITGTGIIPYAKHNQTTYFLLGREAKYTDWEDAHKWAEFAGHRNQYENIWDATIREGYEETMGLFPKDFIEKKIKPNQVLTTYDSFAFLIKIKYDKTLINQFDNFYQFVVSQYPNSFFEKSVIEKGTFEKDQIGWFSYQDILNLSKKGILRRAMTDFLPQLKEFSTNN